MYVLVICSVLMLLVINFHSYLGPAVFTCSSVAQTLAGAAYLPTIAFVVQG